MMLLMSRRELAERSRTDEFAVFCRTGVASLQVRRHPRAPLWAAFLFSFAWFYWRRLYVVGSLILMPAVLIVDLGLQAVASPTWIAILVIGTILLPPAMARRLYVVAFLMRCDRAHRLGLSDADRRSYLAGAGGTSWFAALLSGVLWLSFALTLLHAVLPHHHAGISS